VGTSLDLSWPILITITHSAADTKGAKQSASRDHIRRIIKGDLPAPAEAAEGLDDSALGEVDRLERDWSVGVDLGLEPEGRGLWKLGQQVLSDPGAAAAKGVEHLGLGHLIENRAQVGSVKQLQVVEFHKVRQGFPPARQGREG
jgi:hypothetical protein